MGKFRDKLKLAVTWVSNLIVIPWGQKHHPELFTVENFRILFAVMCACNLLLAISFLFAKKGKVSFKLTSELLKKGALLGFLHGYMKWAKIPFVLSVGGFCDSIETIYDEVFAKKEREEEDSEEESEKEEETKKEK